MDRPAAEVMFRHKHIQSSDIADMVAAGKFAASTDFSYKPDVDDDRESSSYLLMDLLKGKGAEVAYHDRHELI